MRVEFSNSTRKIDAAEWNSVVHASGAPVFYEHAYVSACEQTPLISADHVGYFVVRDGAQPVGVLPVHLQSAPNLLRRLHEAYPEALGQPALLSHTWHCYDAHVPATAEVLPVLLDAMTHAASIFGVPWCGFVNVQRGNALSQQLSAAGLPARHLTDRWTACLTDYEDYLAGLGSRARANLRRNERRSREAGVTVEVLPVDHAALGEVARLCARTAIRFDSFGCYPERAFTGFVAALGDLAHVVEVRQHGRLVAAGVCLADATRFHTWTCGVDYAVDGRYSPYGVLFAESVKLAIRLGKSTLEDGTDNADFKRRYGLSPRHLDAVLMHV